jgi:hypothetical protein
MEKKYLESEVLEVEGEKLFVASTDDVDRHGEVVIQEGIDIASYKENPVVLAYHNSTIPPLGRAEKVGFKKIDGKRRLVYDPVFHGQTELSRLYKEWKEAGIKMASSIGFIAKEWDENKITKSELLEISIVNVPANPAAMSLAYSKGFDRDVVKEAMGESFDQSEKELENEELKKENEQLKEKLASLEVKPPKLATKGRKAKNLVVERNLAIKALNKAIEKLNKVEKEKTK